MPPRINFFSFNRLMNTATKNLRAGVQNLTAHAVNPSHPSTLVLRQSSHPLTHRAPIHQITPTARSVRTLTSLSQQPTTTNPQGIRAAIAPFAVLGIAVGVVSYIIHQGNQPREQDILHDPVDMTYKNCRDVIVSSESYSYVGTKPKGDLSGAIVQDQEGRRYLKKGAKNLNALVQEFLISDVLAMIYPTIQPESLIMQEIKPNGKAQFFTLSRIYDKTMDLEAFIRQDDWREKLAKKPLRGFEIALAADHAFAKQQDMKYANYIIQERDDAYYVASIDHECAGTSFMSFCNRTTFTIDIETLTRSVRDLYEKSDDNHAGLAGDPRAQEFMDVAKQFMSEEVILSFYAQLANLDIKNAKSFIENINGAHGLITTFDQHRFFEEIINVQQGAQKQCCAALPDAQPKSPR